MARRVLVLGALSALALPLALIATWRHLPASEPAARDFNLAVLKHEPTRRTILAYGAHSWELYISRAWLPAFLAAVLVGRGPRGRRGRLGGCTVGGR